jgi:hypothetical protein
MVVAWATVRAAARAEARAREVAARAREVAAKEAAVADTIPQRALE